MKIGDKVRFINENLEGIITEVIGKQEFHVEADDFAFPAKHNELVVVETSFASSTPIKITNETPVLHHQKRKGIQLVFVLRYLEVYDIEVINGTDFACFMSIFHKKNEIWESKGYNLLNPEMALPFGQVDFTNTQEWGVWNFQWIPLPEQSEEIMESQSFTFKFRPKDFVQSEMWKGKKTYRVLLTPLQKNSPNLFPINNFQKEKIPDEVKINMELPPMIIDLHLDKLTTTPEKYSPVEALAFQMDVFEKNFTKALALGYSQITFIHGVGKGTLRNSIMKFLSQRRDIKAYQEDMKDKFGYGALKVLFR